ncbi:MAG TPA: glycoside hydrolase family 43 protein [Pelobium sp.]|nr:glycoside hydrolase family 43 protein [Pelobium sp.]
MLTSFSTSELCGTDEGSKSTSYCSKGRSREFLGTFFGKKVPANARHEGRQGCAEKATAVSFEFKHIRNTYSLTIKLPVYLLFAFTFLISSCSQKAYLFTSFHEPANEGLRMLYSDDAYHWKAFDHIFLKPEIGQQKVMRDPSMVQGPDGTFHLVWTSSWRGDKGFGYASSKDLIHWSKQEFLSVMENEPTTVNVWAPELFYDDVKQQYIIIWASTIPFRFPKGEEEEENNHRMYYTTTKDFKTFSPTKLFIDPGFSVIDAVIVKRAKDDYALVLKDNTRPERDLKVAFADNPLGPYKNVSASYTKNFTEGPSVVKVKDGWLIYFDSYRDKSYEAVKTTDFKTFADANSEISVPEGHKHGTIVPIKKSFLKKLQKSLKSE